MLLPGGIPSAPAWSCTSNAAVVSRTCQMPCKSGRPSGVRGTLYAARAAELCASAGRAVPHDSTKAATPATIESRNQLFMDRCSCRTRTLFGGRGWGRWRKRIGVARKHAASIGRLDRPRPHIGGSVLGLKAFNLDHIASLQRILAPALPVQTVGRQRLARPGLHFAVRV